MDGQKYVLNFERNSPELKDAFELLKRLARKEFKDQSFRVSLVVRDRGTVLHRRLTRLWDGGAYWREFESSLATSTPCNSPSSLRTQVSGIPKKIPGLMDKVNVIKMIKPIIKNNNKDKTKLKMSISRLFHRRLISYRRRAGL